MTPQTHEESQPPAAVSEPLRAAPYLTWIAGPLGLAAGYLFVWAAESLLLFLAIIPVVIGFCLGLIIAAVSRRNAPRIFGIGFTVACSPVSAWALWGLLPLYLNGEI